MMRYCIGVLLLIFLTQTGFAAPICVACNNPDQTYACNIPGGNAAKKQGAALVCVREMAERHNHAACSVLRTQSCDGIPEIVGDEDFTDLPAMPAGPAPAPQAQLDEPVPPPSDERGLGERTLDAMRKSGEAVEDAGRSVGSAVRTTGEAIGSAAKKTWNCIGSGLSEC